MSDTPGAARANPGLEDVCALAEVLLRTCMHFVFEPHSRPVPCEEGGGLMRKRKVRVLGRIGAAG